MKNVLYILFTLVCFSSQAQNNDLNNETKVLFSAYTTAKNGLNYRKEPNENSEILGKFDYGTKVDIVDNGNGNFFKLKNLGQDSVRGKWVGVKKELITVYVFDGYIFKYSSDMEEYTKIVNGKLEIISVEQIDINSNQKMLIEKHIQTSNHLVDYVIIKLKTKNKIVFEHKINYLFKTFYTLTKTKASATSYTYFTVFDECPSEDYLQTFSILGNKIVKKKEKHNIAIEED